MFVRRRKVVNEVEFKEDLEELGLFVSEKDQIRQIAKPDEGFEYKEFPKAKERWNERRREAYDGCVRKIVMERLLALGLQKMELTLGTHHAHVPILVSDDIRENRDRVLVLLPGDSTDLGIWSHRAIGNSTINEGSMVNVVAAAREQGYSIIIANNGALRYDPELGTTVTHATWYARRKPWKLGGMLRDFDLSWNAVPGNMSAEEHVRFVFENVVKKLVPTKAKISIIAADMGATSIIEYLDKKENYNKFKKQLYTMVISESGHHIAYLENPDLKTFLRRYSRAYALSDEDLGEPIADGRFGCGVYSSNTIYHECIIPLCTNIILDYLALSRTDHEDCNPFTMFEMGGDGEDLESNLAAEATKAATDAAYPSWNDV